MIEKATDRSKRCLNCGNRFYNPYGVGIAQWSTRKYCSIRCFGKSDGKNRRDIYKDKTRHPRWKGDNVGYSALHDWIEKIAGKPKLCEICGLNDENRVYHWANISGRYKRKREDFKRMCVSCHRKYDYARNI